MTKATHFAAQQMQGKRFWIWVTGPESYLDENGEDVACLDPASDPTEWSDNWWTCHKDTSAGDLVLLYRSRPKSDLAYLLEARARAKIWREYSPGTLTIVQYEERFAAFFADHKNDEFRRRFEAIERLSKQLGLADSQFDELMELEKAEVPREYRTIWEDHQQLRHDVNRALGLDPEPELAGKWEGSWVCDYVPRFKLRKPLTRAELKADRFLMKEWPALRGNFQQRAYEIPESIWSHLVELLSRKNVGFESTVNRLLPIEMSQDILSEKRLEDALEGNLDKLAPEFQIELFRMTDGTTGRQYPCSGSGGGMGFIDLLCIDRQTGGFLVIELKVVRAGLAEFAQLRSYIGWVKEHLANGKPVRGLLISDGHDEKFRYASSDSDDIAVLDLVDVRTKLGA